jgi:hypothetical protein
MPGRVDNSARHLGLLTERLQRIGGGVSAYIQYFAAERPIEPLAQYCTAVLHKLTRALSRSCQLQAGRKPCCRQRNKLGQSARSRRVPRLQPLPR